MVRSPKQAAQKQNGHTHRSWLLLRRPFSIRGAKRQTKRGRRLRGEMLETRRLLAADMDGFRHNTINPEDVNNDGQVSAIDALMVINAMSRQQRGVADADVEIFTDVNNDGQRSALDALRVINRMSRDHGSADPSQRTAEVRSIDGTGNNQTNVDLGAAGQPLLRVADNGYADGVDDPAGADRPSAREISNLLSENGDVDEMNDRNLSAFLYIWGQFLDHDIDLTEPQGHEGEFFPVDVPLGDPLFDPFATGDQVIPLTRSEFDPTTGTSLDNPRQQVNFITSYIDGSMVYGSDQETADALRSHVDGKLLITDSGLLPTDEDGQLLAGDIRAAENLTLTSMHALFVREHNRLATQITQENPNLSDEDIYQRARAIVIGEIQAITFNEFLPALLGRDAISEYQGYDDSVDPAIANEFSTAAFRFGHTTLNDAVYFIGNEGNEVSDEISLAEAFFNPGYLEEVGIDTLLKAGASLASQEIDLQVVGSLRNFLFGPPGAGGLDLVSLNIQRGRDHGLADYNSTRAAYGLDQVDSFADITRDLNVQAELETLYGDVNNIDLWVGLMAEDHLDGTSVGELTSTIIVDQFERLRDGDRFWYENTFDRNDLREIDHTSLADVIQRNTAVEGLQDNVFLFAPQISGRVIIADATPLDATPLDTATSQLASSQQRKRSDGRDGPAGVAGVSVLLLDADGQVLEETLTDNSGRYRFDSFIETGNYRVTIVQTDGMQMRSETTLDAQISAGDTLFRNMDFQVSLA